MHRGEKKNVLFYVIYDVRFDRSNELMFECSRNATKSKPSLGRHNWLYANDSIENQNQQRALSFAKCGCYWEQRVSGGDTGFVVLCNASSLMTCKVFMLSIFYATIHWKCQSSEECFENGSGRASIDWRSMFCRARLTFDQCDQQKPLNNRQASLLSQRKFSSGETFLISWVAKCTNVVGDCGNIVRRGCILHLNSRRVCCNETWN